jgi:hypothetical protein
MTMKTPTICSGDAVERAKALLAKVTPELLNVRPARLAQMLRDGALAQCPQADNVHQVDYEADAEAIVAALSAIAALSPRGDDGLKARRVVKSLLDALTLVKVGDKPISQLDWALGEAMKEARALLNQQAD